MANEKLEREIEQARLDANAKNDKIVLLQRQLEDVLLDNQKLHESLKRSEEIIEDQVLQIDDTNPAQDPNFTVGVQQDNEKNAETIRSLQSAIKVLSDQLSMVKKDLELERAKKTQEHTEAGESLDIQRKLSAETLLTLEKLIEEQHGARYQADLQSRRGSFCSSTTNPQAPSIKVYNFTSQLAITGGVLAQQISVPKFKHSSAQTEDCDFLVKHTQKVPETETTESSPQVIYTERIVTYTVAFMPTPAFDSKFELVETARFDDPSVRLNIHKLDAKRFTFTLAYTGQELLIDRISSGNGSIPASRKLTEEEDKPMQRIILWPHFALQVEEVCFWSRPDERPSDSKIPKRMYSMQDNHEPVEEYSPNFPSLVNVDISFDRQASKASFLRLDMEKGVLTESDRLPFAEDPTTINIRRILNANRSNRVSRHRLIPLKDGHQIDTDTNNQASYHEFGKSGMMTPRHAGGHDERQDYSRVSVASFVDLHANDRSPSIDRQCEMAESDSGSPYLIDRSKMQPCKSTLVVTKIKTDVFKEKKRKLNSFFQKKNEQKNKNQKPV